VAEIGGTNGTFRHAHQTAVGIVVVNGRDAPGANSAPGVLAEMDHPGPGSGLPVMVGQSHRAEFAMCVVSLQDHAGIFPGDRRAGLVLAPKIANRLRALASLGDKVVAHGCRAAFQVTRKAVAVGRNDHGRFTDRLVPPSRLEARTGGHGSNLRLGLHSLHGTVG